jgi:Sec-independent protein translocase protein TatA
MEGWTEITVMLLLVVVLFIANDLPNIRKNFGRAFRQLNHNKSHSVKMNIKN